MASIFHPAIVILGPTGSGKSELALYLAELVGGEVVNCDSIQVYRGLNIGAAKLSEPERRGIPHHLIDVVDPEADFTAGEYTRQARRVLAEITERGKIPIVAGGTGFYLRALFDGLSPAPLRDTELRNRLQTIASRRPGLLHRYLRRFDPVAASKIHPNDLQKLSRAIEITKQTDQPVSQVQALPRSSLSKYTLLKLGLNPDRQSLYPILNQRAEAMFQGGILDETKCLLERGLSPQAKSLQSLGYKQAVQVLAGSLSIESAIKDCQIKTRQYAKRQLTWFRSEKDVHWLNGFGSDQQIKNEAAALVRHFLLSVSGRPPSVSEQSI